MTAAVVPIFDKGDGKGADWRLTVESLFKAAFVMLDALPEDARRSVARRVQEGSYNRMLPGPLDGDSAPGKMDVAEFESGRANIAGFTSSRRDPGKPH